MRPSTRVLDQVQQVFKRSLDPRTRQSFHTTAINVMPAATRRTSKKARTEPTPNFDDGQYACLRSVACRTYPLAIDLTW